LVFPRRKIEVSRKGSFSLPYPIPYKKEGFFPKEELEDSPSKGG